MKCFDAKMLANGSHPSPIYVAEYCLATFDPPFEVKSEDELDGSGTTIGSATGVDTGRGFFILHKRLFAGFGIEFQAFQHGPLAVETFDKSGLLQSSFESPFSGPQGVRRFTSAYLPTGVGIIGLYGSPGAIAEGHILRVCPLGSDLGPNPSFPSNQVELARLMQQLTSKRNSSP